MKLPQLSWDIAVQQLSSALTGLCDPHGTLRITCTAMPELNGKYFPDMSSAAWMFTDGAKSRIQFVTVTLAATTYDGLRIGAVKKGLTKCNVLVMVEPPHRCELRKGVAAEQVRFPPKKALSVVQATLLQHAVAHKLLTNEEDTAPYLPRQFKHAQYAHQGLVFVEEARRWELQLNGKMVAYTTRKTPTVESTRRGSVSCRDLSPYAPQYTWVKKASPSPTKHAEVRVDTVVNDTGPGGVFSSVHPNPFTRLLDGRVLVSFGNRIGILSDDLQNVKMVAGHKHESANFFPRDDVAAQAGFYYLGGHARLPDGSVLVADRGNHALQMLSADLQQVRTLTKNDCHSGYHDGVVAQAKFNFPTKI